MLNRQIYAEIDSCISELELEKIKTKILFDILIRLDDISNKKLTYR